MVPPVVVETLSIALPLCSSVVTVSVAAVHWAYNVVFAVRVMVDELAV